MADAPRTIFTLREPEGVRGKAPSYEGRRGFLSHFEDPERGLMVFFWEEHSLRGNLHVIVDGKWVRFDIGNMCRQPPKAELRGDALIWFISCSFITYRLRRQASDENFARERGRSVEEVTRSSEADDDQAFLLKSLERLSPDR